MSAITLSSAFDPLAYEAKKDPIPSTLVPRMAERALEAGSNDLPALRVILGAALAHRMTTVEAIGEELGDKAKKVAKGKLNPDPVTYRAVLGFVANLEVA